MAKRKIEVEVEYPDCAICCRDIGEDEYIGLRLELGKTKRHREGHIMPTQLHLGDLDICMDCATKRAKLNQRLEELVESTMSEVTRERN